jgi:hypothetical protein
VESLRETPFAFSFATGGSRRKKPAAGERSRVQRSEALPVHPWSKQRQ